MLVQVLAAPQPLGFVSRIACVPGLIVSVTNKVLGISGRIRTINQYSIKEGKTLSHNEPICKTFQWDWCLCFISLWDEFISNTLKTVAGFSKSLLQFSGLLTTRVKSRQSNGGQQPDCSIDSRNCSIDFQFHHVKLFVIQSELLDSSLSATEVFPSSGIKHVHGRRFKGPRSSGATRRSAPQ